MTEAKTTLRKKEHNPQCTGPTTCRKRVCWSTCSTITNRRYFRFARTYNSSLIVTKSSPENLPLIPKKQWKQASDSTPVCSHTSLHSAQSTWERTAWFGCIFLIWLLVLYPILSKLCRLGSWPASKLQSLAQQPSYNILLYGVGNNRASLSN